MRALMVSSDLAEDSQLSEPLQHLEVKGVKVDIAAPEVVGEAGQVVSIEIDPVTFKYAKAISKGRATENLVPVLVDGGLGYAELQSYDRTAITAACTEILRHWLSSSPLADGSLRR